MQNSVASLLTQFSPRALEQEALRAGLNGIIDRLEQRKRERIRLVAFAADVTKPHARPCAWGFTEIRTG